MSSITKRPCGVTESTITSSAAMPSTPSRKSTTWSICCGRWPTRAMRSALIGVLRSPMFALLDETLFWLGQHPEGVPGGLFADDLPAELATEQAAARVVRRHDACRAAGHEGPPARGAVDPRGPCSHRLRRRASGRISRRAEAGQSAKADRRRAELRRRRAFSRSTISSRSFRSSSPASPTSRWRPRIPNRSTWCG